MLRRFFALAGCALASAGCVDRVKAEPTGIEQADALWGGAGFCARTPSGLACITGYESRGAPVVVQGLTHVTDVALHGSEGCALWDSGVACFRPGQAAATAIPFDAPKQVVATRGYGALICVLHGKGVSCWNDDDKTPTLRPALGTPTRLFSATNRGALCALYDDGTRCFPVGNKGETDASIFLPNVKAPLGVMVNAIGGQVWAVDGDKALYGEFHGTLVVTGNAFAVGNPLDVATATRPFAGATVTLKSIPGIGTVRAMAAYSTSPLILDEHGVSQINAHNSGVDLERWPTETIPTALFSGNASDFFAVEAGVLHQRGWDHGARFDRSITGLPGTKTLFADTYWSCALDGAGGVACVPTQRS